VRQTVGRRKRRVVSLLAVMSAVSFGGLTAIVPSVATASQVTSVTVTLSAPTAGQASTYTVAFKAATALAAGSGSVTLSVSGEAGTVLPATASSYVITDSTHTAGSGTVSVAPTRSSNSATVTFVLPKAITAGDALKVAVGGVTNPPLASSSRSFGRSGRFAGGRSRRCRCSSRPLASGESVIARSPRRAVCHPLGGVGAPSRSPPS